MLEDKWLIRKCKHNQKQALHVIYHKYKNDMLALAISLIADHSLAEDVVHDVFITFARNVRDLELKSSLRSYLLCSVANRVRNLARRSPPKELDNLELTAFDQKSFHLNFFGTITLVEGLPLYISVPLIL